MLTGIAIGVGIGVSAAGLALAIGSVPSVILYGTKHAVFLGASSIRVFALGCLAHSTLTLLVLPLIGMEMEGEVIEYGEPYNTQQPIIR